MVGGHHIVRSCIKKGHSIRKVKDRYAIKKLGVV